MNFVACRIIATHADCTLRVMLFDNRKNTVVPMRREDLRVVRRFSTRHTLVRRWIVDEKVDDIVVRYAEGVANSADTVRRQKLLDTMRLLFVGARNVVDRRLCANIETRRLIVRFEDVNFNVGQRLSRRHNRVRAVENVRSEDATMAESGEFVDYPANV